MANSYFEVPEASNKRFYIIVLKGKTAIYNTLEKQIKMM